MKTNRLLLFPVVLLAFISTGCLDELVLEGNGHLVAEDRHHINFNEVSSSGSFIVEIEEGDDFSVVVDAESNLLPYINTSVSHGNLSIYVQGVRILDNSLPMKVHITTPALSAIRLSGSGTIRADHFVAPDFEVTISGSGRIYSSVDAGFTNVNISGSGRADIEGWSDDAEFVMSGSGKIYGYNLLLRDCDATISGSGNIYANADRNLDAHISGSGNVYVIGNPYVRAHISGSGSVIREN